MLLSAQCMNFAMDNDLKFKGRKQIEITTYARFRLNCNC